MTHTTTNKDQVVVVFRLQRGDDTTTRSLTFDNGLTDLTDTQIENALAQLNHVFLSENTLGKHYTAGSGTAEGTWADYSTDAVLVAMMKVPWNKVVQDTGFEDYSEVTEGDDQPDENPWTCVGVNIERRFATTHYYSQAE